MTGQRDSCVIRSSNFGWNSMKFWSWPRLTPERYTRCFTEIWIPLLVSHNGFHAVIDYIPELPHNYKPTTPRTGTKKYRASEKNELRARSSRVTAVRFSDRARKLKRFSEFNGLLLNKRRCRCESRMARIPCRVSVFTAIFIIMRPVHGHFVSQCSSNAFTLWRTCTCSKSACSRTRNV